jgi:hypothetical protein
MRVPPRYAAAIKMLVVFLLMVMASEAQSTMSSACLAYGPAITVVSGTLARKSFPGQPNYENVHKGDAKETYWFVELLKPICVYEDKNEPDLNPLQKGVHSIQLVLSPRDYDLYKGLVGKPVLATGKLFGAISGHHHTPVLLATSSMKLK